MYALVSMCPIALIGLQTVLLGHWKKLKRILLPEKLTITYEDLCKNY